MLDKVFGAKVDWISQHSVFPEYFRQQFYETGKFFPEFAANIGGGQNVYHFAYYGLYNPLLLPAYLFPSVKMSDYLMIISMLCLIADVLLLYKWLRGNEVSKRNGILTSLLFLLSGPLIFHSYTHVMFVNYMPFLILGFLGIDRYFKKHKFGLFVISVFLMIMTSFYFSIGGILTLVIYGIFRYLTTQEIQGKRVNGKSFFFAGVRFCMPIIVGIMMSGVLLVPTAMALFGGERGGKETISFLKLLLPDFENTILLYDPYGIGLTSLVLIVLFTGITYKKWSEKYIHLACLGVIMLPIFRYLLNGGLYIRGKALIPILPLLCYLIALYLEKQKNREIPFLQGLLPFIVTICLVWVGRRSGKMTQEEWLIFADAGIMLLCGLIYYWKKCANILILAPIFFLLLFGIQLNGPSSRMAERDFYNQVTDKKYVEITKEILEKEPGFYRMEQSGTLEEDAANLNRIWSEEQYISSIYSSTYNDEYQKFRKEIFQMEQPYRNLLMQAGAKNAVFQKLMGIKYVISEKEVPGYEQIEEGVYENKEVYPIAYVTNHLISEKEYQNLAFPYNQTVFLEFAVSQDADSSMDWEKELQSNIQEIDLGLENEKIETEKILSKECSIPKAEKGDIVLVQFEVKNNRPSKDVAIEMEGVRNKLTAKQHIYYNENETFTYAIALEEGQTKLQFQFGKGEYEIRNLKSFIWKKGVEQEDWNSYYPSEFQINKKATKGNQIVGQVEGEGGLLVTSIPYDDNFEVRIDGKEVGYEKVNTAFLGIKISEGVHEVEMIYHAPGLKMGIRMSIAGFLIYLLWSLAYVVKHKKPYM